MGTDIHGVLQERVAAEDTNVPVVPSTLWHTVCEVEDSRNYRLFAALAGVRNGHGFAGVPTHKPITPISETRGLPDDFDVREAARIHGDHHSEDYDDDYPEWLVLGDHSFTWLGLDEVLSWSGWDQILHEIGYIDREAYSTWREHQGAPKGWCGGIAGSGVVQANHMTGIFPLGWTHVLVGWKRPLRESCRHFLEWAEGAVELLESKDPKQARLVLGFDS